MINKCPICEVAMPGPWKEYPDYPFCSKRCRTIDLGRWLGESYTVTSDDRNKTTTNDSDCLD